VSEKRKKKASFKGEEEKKGTKKIKRRRYREGSNLNGGNRNPKPRGKEKRGKSKEEGKKGSGVRSRKEGVALQGEGGEDKSRGEKAHGRGCCNKTKRGLAEREKRVGVVEPVGGGNVLKQPVAEKRNRPHTVSGEGLELEKRDEKVGKAMFGGNPQS